jgi:hypothetical protein
MRIVRAPFLDSHWMVGRLSRIRAVIADLAGSRSEDVEVDADEHAPGPDFQALEGNAFSWKYPWQGNREGGH